MAMLPLPTETMTPRTPRRQAELSAPPLLFCTLSVDQGDSIAMQPLYAPDAQSLASQIEVDDKIKIIRNDETEATFKVSAISNEGISSDGVFVAYSDIRQVQVSQTTTGTIEKIGLTSDLRKNHTEFRSLSTVN